MKMKKLIVVKNNLLQLLLSGTIVMCSTGCGKSIKSNFNHKEALSNTNDLIIYEMPLDLDISEKEKGIFKKYSTEEIIDRYNDITCRLVEEYIVGEENKNYYDIILNNSDDVLNIYNLFIIAKKSNSEQDINKLMKAIRKFINDSENDDLALAIPIISASSDLTRNFDSRFTYEDIDFINNKLGSYVPDAIDKQAKGSK